MDETRDVDDSAGLLLHCRILLRKPQTEPFFSRRMKKRSMMRAFHLRRPGGGEGLTACVHLRLDDYQE